MLLWIAPSPHGFGSTPRLSKGEGMSMGKRSKKGVKHYKKQH
jgi:hypothetical protein